MIDLEWKWQTGNLDRDILAINLLGRSCCGCRISLGSVAVALNSQSLICVAGKIFTMSRSPQILTISSRNKLPKTLAGQGLLFLTSFPPKKTTYEITFENRSDKIFFSGKIWSSKSILIKIWLAPKFRLKLADASFLDMSLTEFKGAFGLAQCLE